MLKKHMAACLVATAFAAAPAFAQTSTTPSGSTDRPTASGTGSATTGSSAMQPGAGAGTGSTVAPSTGTSSTDASSGGASPMGAAHGAGPSTMAQGANQGGAQGQFMTQMRGQQMMASKLIGTTVVSTNNESIGDVNDVILDRNGQVMAVVVGVGGFLGIGEKDVAVPFASLEFASRDQMNAANNGGGNVTSTGSTTGGPTNRSTATTGNTGGNGASASPDSANNAPDRVMLRMTKAELQAAPSFKASGGGTGSNNAGSNSSGAQTAPKQ
jgi:sporulation protein YlmC with PRC-barrel domain